MKKLLSVLLIAFFILQAVAFASDTAKTAEQTNVEIVTDNLIDSHGPENSAGLVYNTDIHYEKLSALGIVKGDVHDNPANGAKITRATFVAMAMRAVNAEITNDVRQVFADVPEDYWAAGMINTAYDLGIVSGAGGLFEPDQAITHNDAVVILIRLLNRADMAEALGGYPYGYLSAASSFNITGSVVPDGKYVSNSDLYKMLMNTLECSEFAVFRGYFGEMTVMNISTKKTMMNYYLDVYKTKGILNAVGPSSIYTASGVRKGIIMIDNMDFGGEYDEYIDMLGMTVEVLYKQTDDDRQLVFAAPAKTNTVRTLDADAIESFSSNTYIYHNAAGKREKAELAYGHSIVYNGSGYTSGIDNPYKPVNGNAKLIDNNNDGIFDVVVIQDTYDIVVGTVVTDSSTVYDLYYDLNGAANKNCFVSFDNDGKSDRMISLTNTEGKQISPVMLSKGSILTVSESADGRVLHAECSSKTASGKISQIYTDDGGVCIEIDGSVYKCTDKCAANCEVLMTIGMSVSVRLNVYGKVADIVKKTADGAFRCGYTIQVALNSDLAGEALVKLLTAEGSVEIYEINHLCRIDGAAVKGGEKQVSILNTAISAEGEVIMYLLNADGKISDIDTAYFNAEKEKKLESMRRERKIEDGNIGHKTLTKGGVFRETFFWSPDRTTVFTIYKNEVNDEDRYRVATTTYPYKNDYAVSVDLYKNTDSYYASALVTEYETAADESSDKTMYVIEKIVCAQNDGTEFIELTVNQGKGSETITMDKNLFDKRNLGTGDIINFDAVEGKVIGGNIVKLYDWNTNLPTDAGMDFADNAWNSQYKVRFGYVYDKKDDGFTLYNRYTVPYDENILATSKVAGTIISVEKNKRGKMSVENCSAADLKPYLECGEERSEVVVRYVYSQVYQIIIIKRQ